jgi:hypothetical protein
MADFVVIPNIIWLFMAFNHDDQVVLNKKLLTFDMTFFNL